MIISLSSLLFLYFSIIGNSYFFKRLIIKNKSDLTFQNKDTFYGIFFYIFLSLVLNFFLPLKYFFVIISLFGIYYFIANFKSFKSIDFKVVFIVLLILSFISSTNNVNIDSEYYHLQSIQKFNDNKVIFGFAILDKKFGMNSLWHLMLSMFYFKINNFNIAYIFNAIPLTILIIENIQNLKKKVMNLSAFFLFFSLTFLVLFSFIHPSGNGLLLDHLSSPEVDIASSFVFIFFTYCFIKIFESKNNEYHYLLPILFGILFVTKLSYIYVSLVIILCTFIFKKERKIYIRLNIIVGIFIILFLFRNLIISGCLIYPVASTCFNFLWTIDNEIVLDFYKMIKSFSRSAPTYHFENYQNTIYSLAWFLPWFKGYFLKTSILQFLTLTTLCNLFLYLNTIKKKLFDINLFTYLYLFFLVGLFWWLQVPEVRFAHGIIISMISINCYFLYKKLFKNFYLVKPFFYIFVFSLTLLTLKNYNKVSNILNIDRYMFSNRSNEFQMLPIKNDEKIVMAKGLCRDIEVFCTYEDQPSLQIIKKLGYNIIYLEK